MMEQNRKSPRSQSGFTLAETLIALVLMSLVGLIVTGGIMTASRVYGRIQDKANAELLLSTTLIEMRNELDRAEEITLDNTDPANVNKLGKYRSSTGNWRELVSGKKSENSVNSVMVTEYKGYQSLSEKQSETHELVSVAAASDMRVEYDQITYNPTRREFKIEHPKVYKGDQLLAKVNSEDKKNNYYIRSLENVRDLTGFVGPADPASP